MTILGLSAFLNKKVQDRYVQVDISTFKNNSVAIDAFQFIHSSMSLCVKKAVDQLDNVFEDKVNLDEIKKAWLIKTLEYALTWLNYKIIPVFVFDGPDRPEEKAETQQKRRDLKKKAASRRKEIEDIYASLSPLEKMDSMTSLVEEYTTVLVQNWAVSNESVFMMKEFIDKLGLPWLQSTTEGEKLCCALAREGYVNLVSSTDGDCLVYNCPILINKFAPINTIDPINKGKFRTLIPVTYPSKIMESLGLTEEQFIDFCIMCGCDYNKNIPKVGPANSYTLIKEHKSIDNLPPKYDKTILKVEACRRLLSHEPVVDTIFEGNWSIRLTLLFSSEEYLSSLGVGEYLYYSNRLREACYFIKDLNDLVIPCQK